MTNRSVVAAGLPKRARVVGATGKLTAEVWQGDKLIRVEEFVDPREEFCRFFNEQQERIEEGRQPNRQPTVPRKQQNA
jgi:hypothetical protein